MSDRVQELVELIKKASQQYYMSGDIIMTDKMFDKYIDELKSIDPENKILSTVGWGFDIHQSSKLPKTHLYGEVNSISEKHHHSNTVSNLFYSGAKSVKLDGCSVVSYYLNGAYTMGISRGGGIEGLDVTEKIIDKVPHYFEIDGRPFTGAVRGEFMLSDANWKKFYPEAPNPRNITAGFLNRDVVTKEETSAFDYVVYKIHGSSSHRIESYSEILKALQDAGFDTVNYSFEVISPNDADETIAKLNERNLPYDGLVFTFNLVTVDNNGYYIYKEAAYKPNLGGEVETIVTGITWEQTRLNKFVPVVNVEARMVSGASVENPTGYNYEFVSSNGIGVGARITMIRSGETIPKIMDVLERGGDIQAPTECPICHHKLVKEGVHLQCVNKSCPNLDNGQLWTWINTNLIPKGLGRAKLEPYIDRCGMRTVEDLYTKEWLNADVMYDTQGYGESTVELLNKFKGYLKEAISMSDFLLGLSLKGVGPESANKVVQLVDDFTGLTSESLREILDGKITYIAVDSLCDNIDLIQRLLKLVVIKTEVVPEITVPESKSFRFKVCATGRMTLTKSQFEKLCNEHDIEFTNDLDDDCKYLVLADINSTSSKAKRARESDTIELISEEDFKSKYLM